jgi:hypothetical protein
VADLYDTDIVSWSDQQAELLRRLAAGERVNNAVDWPNVIEEIESVGNEERKAVASALMRGIQHKLYVLCWPRTLAVQHWQAEIRIHLAEADEDFRESMRKDIEPALPRLYRRAGLAVERHVLDEGAPQVPLPPECPWTLDELLAEGEAALQYRPPGDR